jgi:transposase
VIDVDEFRTSKLCCDCHHVTEKVSFDGVKVNSVLRCTNNECGTIVDQDINGSKNILALFVDMLRRKERLEAFSRKLVAEKSGKTVESVIMPSKK